MRNKSFKRDYLRSDCSKLADNHGGWYCPCCNPYGCHPRSMKKLARRRFRRVSKQRVEVLV